MKLGAAPEIDRHTLQLSEACPAVATSLRVMNLPNLLVQPPLPDLQAYAVQMKDMSLGLS